MAGRKLKTLAACWYDYVTLFSYMHNDICYAQSIDMRNPGIVLCKPYMDPWFLVQTMDWPRNPEIASLCAKHKSFARVQSIDM